MGSGMFGCFSGPSPSDPAKRSRVWTFEKSCLISCLPPSPRMSESQAQSFVWDFAVTEMASVITFSKVFKKKF